MREDAYELIKNAIKENPRITKALFRGGDNQVIELSWPVNDSKIPKQDIQNTKDISHQQKMQ